MLVSSKVSLITVSFRYLSFASRFPPGSAICPDQGSLEFWTRLTKRTRSLSPSSFKSRATDAFAPCSSDAALRVSESFSIEKVNLNQHILFVTPKSNIKTILSSTSTRPHLTEKWISRALRLFVFWNEVP